MKLKYFFIITYTSLNILLSQKNQYQIYSSGAFGTLYGFQIDSELDYSIRFDSVFPVMILAANACDATA